MNSAYNRQASYWSIANRVSYLLDFQGPSLAVDNACSSSPDGTLLRWIFARRVGACKTVPACGVNLIVDPIQYLSLSAALMLSSVNTCCSPWPDAERVRGRRRRWHGRAEAPGGRQGDGDHI